MFKGVVGYIVTRINM